MDPVNIVEKAEEEAIRNDKANEEDNFGPPDSVRSINTLNQ